MSSVFFPPRQSISLRRAANANSIAQAPRFQGCMGHAPEKIQDSGRFYQAQPKPWLIRLFQGSVHHFLSRPLGFKLDLSKDDIKTLQTLNKQPGGLILTPNHTSIADTFTLQELGYQTGIHPATMTALGTFDRKIMKIPYQMIWPFLSRFGHFSVNPGNSSVKRSVSHAEHILEEGKSPLCIFPEGRFSWNNQGVSPCRNGTMRIAIEAAKESRKPVQVVPVGIYYSYSQKAEKRVSQMLSQQERTLEKKLGKSLPELPSDAKPQQRMDRLMEALLNGWEREYDLAKGDSQHSRIEAIQEACLKRMLGKYNARQSDTHDPFQQIRYLSQAVCQHQAKYQKPARWRDWLNPWSKAWKTYRTQRQASQRDLQTLKDMEYLLIHQAALQKPLPAEYSLNSQLDTLARLNCLILGKHPSILSVVRNCTAHIKVGEPVTVRGQSEKEGEWFIDRANRLTERLKTNLEKAVEDAAGLVKPKERDQV